MYCEKCHAVYIGELCPYCGSKDGREPLPNDPCFLVIKEKLWSGVLADVLKQNNIPFFEISSLGAGMAIKVGPLYEQISFFVPYACLHEAQDIVEELFSEQ